MNRFFKRKSILLAFAGVFLLMFIFRFIYGYINPGRIIGYSEYGRFNSAMMYKRNYASEKFKEAEPSSDQSFLHELKYEKIANVKSRSVVFDLDKYKLNKLIDTFKAVIQYEENSGKVGERKRNS